jgi:hypothetical protein
LIAGPGLALAGTNTHLDAKIKPLSNGKLRYQGKVRSSSGLCLPNRKIKISAPGLRIRVTTDADGKFRRVGKALESGTEVTFSLKALGDECVAIELSAPAP